MFILIFRQQSISAQVSCTSKGTNYDSTENQMTSADIAKIIKDRNVEV